MVIELRLREAVLTLKRVRGNGRDMPAGFTSSWPPVVHDWQAYGGEAMKKRQEDATNRPAAPTPGAIDRMDQALQWLWWVPNGSRIVVVARATGVSWGVLVKKTGHSQIEVRTRHKVAIETILEKLIDEN